MFLLFFFVKNIIIPPNNVVNPASVEQSKAKDTLDIRSPKLVYDKTNNYILILTIIKMNC